MNFIYPIGFVALAGLIIPLIIHLWSVKQGKTLKIGSISLLGESASASAKSLNLSDWPLFILRCLLLISLALLLAQPYFKQTEKVRKNVGWILLEQGEFKNVYHQHQKTIDSLLKLGFELHRFNVGFDKIELADTLSSYKARNISYTSLLKQLSDSLPNNDQVIVFANHQLKNFDGNLPKVGFKLTWKTINQSDTIKKWTSNLAGKNYEANSKPSSTSYTMVANEPKPAISILIYNPSNNDYKYIKAAVMAIGEFTNRKIELVNWKNGTSSIADVGFWLSDQRVDKNFKTNLKADATLFAYEKGKNSGTSSTLNLNADATDHSSINLKKRVVPIKYKGLAVWTDGFGNPILTFEKSERLNEYHCYTQLNPQWNDLVWNDQFVKALLPIVIHDQNNQDFGFENNPLDQRMLTKQQNEVLQGNVINEVSEIKTTKPLDYLFWLMALLVLFAERWLSFRKKQVADGKS